LIFIATDYLAFGEVNATNSWAEHVRHSSIRVCLAIVQQLSADFKVLNDEWNKSRTLGDAERCSLEGLRKVANTLGIRMKFAADSVAGETPTRNNDGPLATETRSARFFRECSPLLDAMIDIPFPDVIHSALETLQTFIPLAPGPVLLKVANAVRRGELGSYQSEQLGIALVVKILRLYFADHQHLLQQDRSYRDAVVNTLSTFVRAGWPEAFELTSRLEQVFR
jgi:hypothetical protein